MSEFVWYSRTPARAIGCLIPASLRVVLWPGDPDRPEQTREIPLGIVPCDLRMPNSEFDLLINKTERPHSLVRILRKGENCEEIEAATRTVPPQIRAFDHSMYNKREISESEQCGCYYCLSIFRPHEISKWIGDPATTAVCPHCGIDSVIASASGYPITKEFLQEMNDHWF